ncbi:MAG: hypothetical protein K2K56_09025 [Lachnospiraceae bacterium]|nr:hypothetical protein [Lachnospiraceae bacterium]
MMNLTNVYNYYSTQVLAAATGSNRTNSRFNSHKRDDLKTIYNNMVRQNTHSPLYKFTFSDATQAYAIGIKEAAMALEAESKSLSGQNNGAFDQMTVVSDDENVVFASLNGSASEDIPENLSIQVNTLASGQVNVGTYLPSGESSFSAGDYSFGIAVGRNQYTFQLTVHEGDTNQQIQRNLAMSINENNIGVRATLRNNRTEGTSALVLRSDAVGLPITNDLYFHFDETYLENDIARPLGIDHVESMPANAEFYINDTLHSSISNRISLNHTMDIDLLSTSDKPINVHLVPDEHKISNKLTDFMNSYNELVDIARNSSNQKGSAKLFKDITNMANRNKEALKAAGLTVDTNGYMNRLADTDTDSSRIQSLFDDELSDFRRDIKRTTEKMTLNPLNYIDKIIITYPNTTGTYPNPYNPSRYSGLLFNDYA